MTIRKKLPTGKQDGRRNYPVDRLRSKYWCNEVLKLSGCGNLYALSTQFAEVYKKWTAYNKGSQPNNLTLDNVEEKFPGTKNVFLSGPNDLKLWPALHETDLETLTLIAELSERVDAKIAKLRLDVLNKTIQFYPYYSNGDRFEDRMAEVIDSLKSEIHSPLKLSILKLIVQWVKPYKQDYLAYTYSEISEFSSSSRYTKAAYQALYKGLRFSALELSTVKEKGRRKDDE